MPLTEGILHHLKDLMSSTYPFSECNKPRNISFRHRCKSPHMDISWSDEVLALSLRHFQDRSAHETLGILVVNKPLVMVWLRLNKHPV